MNKNQTLQQHIKSLKFDFINKDINETNFPDDGKRGKVEIIVFKKYITNQKAIDKMDNSYEVTIKFDDKTNSILVSKSHQGLWMELGLVIEGLGVLMAMERKKFQNPKGIKTKEELLKYVQDYVVKVANDYDKSFEGIPSPFN